MKSRSAISGFIRFVLGLSLLGLSALGNASSRTQLLPNPNPNAQYNFYGNAVALSPDGSIAVWQPMPATMDHLHRQLSIYSSMPTVHGVLHPSSPFAILQIALGVALTIP